MDAEPRGCSEGEGTGVRMFCTTAEAEWGIRGIFPLIWLSWLSRPVWTQVEG